MKINTSLISRLTVLTGAMTALCFVSTASAQGVQEAESKPAAATTDAPTPEPGRVGSMAGVGQKPRKSDAAKANPSPGASAQMAGAAMADGDRQFMQMAAKDGMKEVHMGQMAVDKSQNAEVKKLGSKIVADHTKANNQLMAIAQKKGMKLDTSHKMDKMSKKDMENFDQAWLGMMVTDHQKDIAAYDKQAKMGADPELKSYAGKTLPVLKKHLAMVQAAQKKMASR